MLNKLKQMCTKFQRHEVEQLEARGVSHMYVDFTSYLDSTARLSARDAEILWNVDSS